MCQRKQQVTSKSWIWDLGFGKSKARKAGLGIGEKQSKSE